MKGKIFTKLAILTILGLFLVVPSCFAATVLETTEEYTENGAFIYGSTRFDPTTIMTPDVVFNAGINESKVWVALGNKLNDLKPVTPYYYDGASWFKVASTKVTPITDETTIEKIEDNLHIFFVGEEMKTIEVPYDGTVDEGSETEGAVYDKENKQFLVPALSFGFEFKIGGVEVEVETNVDTNIKEGNTEEVKEESFVAEGHKTVKEGDTYKVLPYDANNVTDEKELKALIAKGGTVKLGGNIELAEKSIGITGEAVVLDLNGYTLSVSEKYTSNNVIWTSAELTVKDSSNGKGTIDTIINEESYIVALYAYNGGKITIENGTYIGIPDAEEASDIIYVAGKGSQVIINGGNFVGDETFTLNKYDSDRAVASMIVKGGTFTGFNPADNAAEGEGTNFVAEGYRSVYDEETNTYTVKAYDINNVDDDDSLKYALANAKKGDTINLAAGNYSKVLIDSRKKVAENITLVGTEGVNIAGVNMNGANYGFVPEGLTFKNITFTDDVNVNNTDKLGITCENLSIIGCTFSNAAFLAGNNSTIDGLTIENNKFNGTNTTNKTSILLQGEHINVLVKGNTIDGPVYNAVQCTGVSGKTTIVSNTIKNTGSRAIRISTVTSAELTISNNIISNVNTNPEQAEENMGQVIKVSAVSGTTAITPTAEGNTYNGKALSFIDGIAVAPVEE